MARKLGRIGRWILDLFFPRKCIFCQRILTLEQKYVCTSCQLELPICSLEEKTVAGTVRCVSVLRYEGGVRESILRYKFEHREFYSRYYGELLAAAVSAKFPGADLVTWVPISRRRLRKRGFNQSEKMAREIAKRCGLPCMAALVKTVDNPAQSKMSGAKERRRNVAGVYRAIDQDAWRGKAVLLVDDVVTTGATLSECCTVLAAAGAKSVSCVTLAATSQMRS